jgi:ribosomal protein S15P/S13E
VQSQRCFRMASTLALAAAIGMAGIKPAGAKTPDVDKLLQAGNLPAAESTLQKHLKTNPKDDNARFGLGMVQFVRGAERLIQSLHKYGLRSHENFVPFLRLPAPRNVEPDELSYKAMRGIFESLQADLKKAETTLAKIQSKDVKVPVHVALIRFDFNGDGKAEEGETLWKVFEKLTRAGAVGEALAMRFAISFDRADVHWMRGYCHLLMGMTDFILAHDWKDSFERTAQLFFKAPDSPFAYLRRTKEPDRRNWFDSERIADAIAFIHLIRFKVIEPKRMETCLAHLEAVIQQSRECWKYAEAETDDDHEWIPNPRQSGVIPGMKVTPEMIAGWKEFLDEADAILKGKKLVPHWRIHDGRGINVRKVFTQPREFDLVLWVQGSAAAPYLERGTLTKKQFWERLMRTFRGNFIGFAIWVN